MFCTNCGEQMRDIDRFCAVCGTAAAPRATKAQPAASTPPVTRVPQSTAEAARAPLAATSTTVRQPELAFSAPPLSAQQERQAAVEAEEIASVRDLVPMEVLPPDFPPATSVGEARVCGACGERNPEGNRFCERCGRPLDAPEAAVPVARNAWLDVPEPAQKPVAAPAKALKPVKTVPVAAPPTEAAAGKDDDFFYFYDDSSTQGGNRKLLIVFIVVLVLGLLGVIYLLSRPSAKSQSGGNVTITMSPTEAEVAASEAHDFSATVNGSGDTDVIWSVAEGNAGGKVVSRGAQAQGGAVTSMGVYVAPTTPGTYHVVATSKADPSKSATASVVVSGK